MSSRIKTRVPSKEKVISAPSSIGRDAARYLRDNQKKIKRSKKKRCDYLPENIEGAARALQAKTMSVRDAAAAFNVPPTTVHRKSHGQNPGPIGGPFVLDQTAEAEFADMIRSYCSSGNVMEKEFFRKVVLKYTDQRPPPKQRKKPFSCSDSWISGFLNRQGLKEFDHGKAKPLGIHRRIACNPKYVKEFIQKFTLCFNEYKKHLSEVLKIPPIDLTDEQVSAGIFAIDETSISNCTPLRYELKQLTPNSVACLQADVSGRSTTNASLLEVYCANGSMPFHVMTTKQTLSTEDKVLLASIDQRSQLLFCDLESGAFDSLAHAQCLAKIGDLRGSLPSLVIQDCPKTHKGVVSLNTAKDKGIHLMTLPHHSSWYLQVPDDLPFATLKSRHYRSMKEYRRQNSGKSPNLLMTLNIFLTSRKDVLTEHIIKKAFENCGQFPFSPRQIQIKAERAQQRCGMDIAWEETQELSPVEIELEQLRLTLAESRSKLQQIASSTRRSSGPLEDLLKEQEALEIRQAEEAHRRFEEKQSAARREVHAIASTPIPDDPPLFSQQHLMASFPDTEATSKYLQNQLLLMKPVIQRYEEEVKQSLDSRSGCYMINPKQTVTPRDLLAVRKTWIDQVKARIKAISKIMWRQKELKQACLTPLCDKKKGKSRWNLCPVCTRGFCPDCSQTSPMQQHVNHCTPVPLPTVQYPSGPVQVVHTTVNISDASTVSSIQIRTRITPTASPPTSIPASPPFSIPSSSHEVDTTVVSSSGASEVNICPSCQLLTPDSALGCQWCQHPGYAQISVTLSVSDSSETSSQHIDPHNSPNLFQAESTSLQQQASQTSLQNEINPSFSPTQLESISSRANDQQQPRQLRLQTIT